MDNTSLKVTVTPVVTEPCLVTLNIEVASEDALVIYNKAEKAIASRASLPGFRPGKLPKAILQKQFGPQISVKATEDIIDKAFRSALESSGYSKKVVGEPALDDSSRDLIYEAGKPFAFSVVIETMPEFPLPEYKGLQLSREVRELKDSEVDKQAEMFLEMSAKMEKSDGPSAEGDILTADYQATLPEGLEIAEADKYMVKADNSWMVLREPSQLPGIVKSLAGMKPGEERDIKVTFPEDFRIEALRGLTLDYHVKLNELRSRIVPELNDEFVKTYGMDSVDKFKEVLRKRLEQSRDAAIHDNFVNQINGILFKDASFDLPPKRLKQLCNEMYRSKLEQEKRAGKSEEELKAGDNDIKQAALDSAKNALRSSFIIQAIIEAEKIVVNNEDYSQMLYHFASQEKNGNVKEILRKKRESGEVDKYLSNLLVMKAYDKIIEEANIVDTEAPAEEEGK